MKNLRTNLSLALTIACRRIYFGLARSRAEQTGCHSLPITKGSLTPTTRSPLLTASAKEHQELAAIYKKTPPNAAMETKHGTSVEGVSHCRCWAQLEVEQAKEADALASIHRGMAKETGKK